MHAMDGGFWAWFVNVLYDAKNCNIFVGLVYNYYFFEKKKMNFWDFLNQHHFNTPKGVLIFGIIFGSLFVLAAIEVALIFYYGYRFDRYLLKYHFEDWKLLHGSRKERRNFKYPDDPQFDKLQLEQKKVRRILEFIWIIAFFCSIAIALLI